MTGCLPARRVRTPYIRAWLPWRTRRGSGQNARAAGHSGPEKRDAWADGKRNSLFALALGADGKAVPAEQAVHLMRRVDGDAPPLLLGARVRAKLATVDVAAGKADFQLLATPSKPDA